MKNLNYLSKIGGYFSASQSNDVSLDRRFTVGSPSGFNSKLMLKLVSVLVLILTIGSGNVWGQTTVSKSVSEIYGAVANGTQECTLWDDDVLSISVNCNGNNGKVYGTGTEWRLYQGNSAVVTISVTSGELTSVTLTFTNSNNGKISYSGSALTSGSAVAVSGSSADFTVGATSGTSGQIRLSAFSVTYSSGGGGCTPGDVSSLSAGDVVVMYYSTNELDGVSSGYGSKSTFTTSPDGDFPLTVERGYNNTGFSFKNGSYYLRMNAGNSNTALELSTTKDASASWNVSFDGSKVATIQNCNYTTRYIKYNTSSPRFATYLTGVNNTYNVKLYKICDDTKYTVTYNGNGNTSGSVPTDNTEYDSGDEVTVKGNTGSLAKTGYTFGGWNTQADGNGTNYTAGSGTFNISANTTLYAKWIPTYNVYLASGCIGGSYTSSEGTSGSGTGIYDGYAKYSGITAGTSVTITASPTSGYQFDGWTDGG